MVYRVEKEQLSPLQKKKKNKVLYLTPSVDHFWDWC